MLPLGPAVPWKNGGKVGHPPEAGPAGAHWEAMVTAKPHCPLLKKHSQTDLLSRLKTRKILGVGGEDDDGEIHRSKVKVFEMDRRCCALHSPPKQIRAKSQTITYCTLVNVFTRFSECHSVIHSLIRSLKALSYRAFCVHATRVIGVVMHI